MRVLACEEAAAVLVSCGVNLVVVGGAALWMRGDRSTRPKDLDVVPAPRRSNLVRLVSCSAALGAATRTWPSVRQLDQFELVTAQTSYGPIDVLSQRGREEFEALRSGAAFESVLGVSIPVASVVDVLRLRRQHKEGGGV